MKRHRTEVLSFFLFGILFGVAIAQQPSADKIDWDRARRLYQRMQAGETLTAEERAYLDRAKAARRAEQAGKANNRQPVVSKLPPDTKPLCDMTADDRYKGEDGGLYGGGRNEPPARHLAAAIEAARQIQPLNAAGKPDPDGRIVLLSVGMSNTTQEFQKFIQLANGNPNRSPKVTIVDGAQGGLDAAVWARSPDVPAARNPWPVVDERLKQAGAAPAQVQVIWLKQARANPEALGEFPKHADQLKSDLATIVRTLKSRFANLRIVYLSSRIYADYAQSQLNPEPYAYESAFVVRSLIADQIRGEPSLSFEASAAKAPLLLWGAYLWANGEQGRKIDDLVWRPEDFGPDGTHPSASGREKVALQLLEFFKATRRPAPGFLDRLAGMRADPTGVGDPSSRT